VEDYISDFDYYLNSHVSMAIDLLSNSDEFIELSVEKSVDIVDPKIESSFVARCHYYFKEALNSSSMNDQSMKNEKCDFRFPHKINGL
jgi:hypothetical protein